ncbi:MAG: hypothetical protein ACFFF9_01405 [Candidatus Thorarchaeota archaeon]
MSDRQTTRTGQKALHLIVKWVVVGIILFVFITGAYISLAAYTGQSVQFTGYDSLQTPAILTGIVLFLFVIASILFSSFTDDDGAWIIKTGPYVR